MGIRIPDLLFWVIMFLVWAIREPDFVALFLRIVILRLTTLKTTEDAFRCLDEMCYEVEYGGIKNKHVKAYQCFKPHQLVLDWNFGQVEVCAQVMMDIARAEGTEPPIETVEQWVKTMRASEGGPDRMGEYSCPHCVRFTMGLFRIPWPGAKYLEMGSGSNMRNLYVYFILLGLKDCTYIESYLRTHNPVLLEELGGKVTPDTVAYLTCMAQHYNFFRE